MGIAHGLSSVQYRWIMNVEVPGNIPFLYLYAISRLISFPSYPNNDGITYPNFTKKSIASLDLIEEIAEHFGGFLNNGRTPLYASLTQPFLPFFLVV